MEVEDDFEGTELQRRQVVIHGDSGNGKILLLLLGTLIAIVGFVGGQVWAMSDRLARVETNVQTILKALDE